MSDRYEFAILLKQIFFYLNEFFELNFIYLSFIEKCLQNSFFSYKSCRQHIQFKKKKKWRIWVSIPVPPACKAGALPFELIPPAWKTTENNQGYRMVPRQNWVSEMFGPISKSQKRLWQLSNSRPWLILRRGVSYFFF